MAGVGLVAKLAVECVLCGRHISSRIRLRTGRHVYVNVMHDGKCMVYTLHSFCWILFVTCMRSTETARCCKSRVWRYLGVFIILVIIHYRRSINLYIYIYFWGGGKAPRTRTHTSTWGAYVGSDRDRPASCAYGWLFRASLHALRPSVLIFWGAGYISAQGIQMVLKFSYRDGNYLIRKRCSASSIFFPHSHPA